MNQHPLDPIARVCHEVNRAYCQALGDNSQPTWEEAPEWQRSSARMGVDLHLSGDFGPEASHISWMRQKIDEGWKYGPTKDPEKKEHPCIVPFADLPREQQAKDYIFRAVVHALRVAVLVLALTCRSAASSDPQPPRSINMRNVQSPRTDDGAIEQEIQQKGLNAPRITPQHIEEQIASEHYFTAADGSVGEYLRRVGANSKPKAELELLTFCVLVLRNGFTVTGESACVSPQNFDAEIGRKVAYENAKQKIWVLEGYLLRDFLHANTMQQQFDASVDARDMPSGASHTFVAEDTGLTD